MVRVLVQWVRKQVLVLVRAQVRGVGPVLSFPLMQVRVLVLVRAQAQEQAPVLVLVLV